ncbi:hypothetical protein KKF34_15320 [Myxococcota bacterium]|nr:hypothetical protein [Myxococcota bacterium]MBU1383074.1 hypothetical protein [Myxococcota bacterium]MBU1498247.1 hypothetical protein [Myxococcota bacterium]
MDNEKKQKLIYLVIMVETAILGILPLTGIFKAAKSQSRIIIYVFFAIAIIEMVFIHFFRKVAGDLAIERIRNSDDVNKEKKISRTRFNVNIVTWAVASASAIYGVVAGFLGGNRYDFYMLWSFAILSLLLYPPKSSENP